jgi:hypothetical protein
MEAVVKSGGSVLHKGQVLTRLEHLPSAADLAEGDAEQSKAVLADIERQQKALDAQRKQLTDAAKGQSKQSAKADDKPEAARA